MRSPAFLATLAFAATSLAQGVDEGIAPSSGPPDGCQTTVSGTFAIGIQSDPSKWSRDVTQASVEGALSCTLKDGILHDSYSRTGAIVANHQFQFDGPPQAGSIYTGGFSICKNDSLAIGGTTRWWRCMSGAFGNLYDESIGEQCHEIRIQAIYSVKSSSSSSLPTSISSAVKSGSSGLSTTVSKTASASTASQTRASASGSASSDAGSSLSATPSASKSGAVSGSSTPGAAPPANGAAALPYPTIGATFASFMVLLSAALFL